MKGKGLKRFIFSIGEFAKKHSSELLIGIGVSGTITAIGMAIRATPKAVELKREAEANKKEPLTKVEVVKSCWKCYIPTIAVEGLSIACFVGASSVNARRNTALAAAYALSESALSDYQEKMIEVVGDRKAREVKDAVAKKRIETNPIKTNEVIITSKGDTLCYDAFGGRYFKSDRESINQIVNELNRRMRDENYISLNEFYYEIGLDGTKIGDFIGWNIEKGYIDIDYSSQLTIDGIPCLVIDFQLAPEYNYYS